MKRYFDQYYENEIEQTQIEEKLMEMYELAKRYREVCKGIDNVWNDNTPSGQHDIESIQKKIDGIKYKIALFERP